MVAYLAYFEALFGNDEDALKFAGAASDLGYPKDSNPLPGAYWITALHAKRYSEAASTIIKTLDLSDPEQARTAEVLRVIFVALADPNKQSAAIEVARRLYPKSRSSGTSRVALTDVGPCLQSGISFGLLGAHEVAFELANQCLDQVAPGGMRENAGRWPLWTPEKTVS